VLQDFRSPQVSVPGRDMERHTLKAAIWGSTTESPGCETSSALPWGCVGGAVRGVVSEEQTVLQDFRSPQVSVPGGDVEVTP